MMSCKLNIRGDSAMKNKPEICERIIFKSPLAVRKTGKSKENKNYE